MTNELIEPTASIPYDGTKLASIHQSSAAKEALLLHRAMKRRSTAKVARIPHATVTRMTWSRPGLTLSMVVMTIDSLSVLAMTQFLWGHCERNTEAQSKLVAQGEL